MLLFALKYAIINVLRASESPNKVKTGENPFFALLKTKMPLKNKKKLKITLFIATFMLNAVFFAFYALASETSKERIIELVNESRVQQGLPELKENTYLSGAAMDKANDMLKKDYFAHTSPEGIDPWHWIKKRGYDYKYAGENLAINYTDAEEEHEAWMKSATHRKNIMSPLYKEIGVAVLRGKIDGKETILAVQFFGTPMFPVGAENNSAPVQEETNPILAEKEPEALSIEKDNFEAEKEVPGFEPKAPVWDSEFGNGSIGFSSQGIFHYSIFLALILVIGLAAIKIITLKTRIPSPVKAVQNKPEPPAEENFPSPLLEVNENLAIRNKEENESIGPKPEREKNIKKNKPLDAFKTGTKNFFVINYIRGKPG